MINFIILSLLFSSVFGVHVVDHDHDDDDHHDDDDRHEEDDHHHEAEELFHAFLNRTGLSRSERLSLLGLGDFLSGLNEQCLSAENVFQALGANSSQGLDEHQFANASWLILWYLRRGSTERCNVTQNGASGLFERARTDLFGAEAVCSDNITTLIYDVIRSGKYRPNQTSTNCFSSSDIFPRCSNDPEELDHGLMRLLISIYEGYCLLPDPQYFVDEIFRYLNPDGGNNANQSNFENLLRTFNIGQVASTESHDHDHEDDHDHENEAAHTDDHGHETEENHSDDDDHDHTRRKRNTDENNRINLPSKCFSGGELLQIAGSARDNNNNLILTESGLLQICPAILQQVTTNACTPEVTTEPGTNPSSYTTAQKYGYGTVAVLIISLLAFGGLLFFPVINTPAYKLVKQYFVALGVGALSGDAILHLIPEVVGLHQHGGVAGEHDHEEEEEDKSYLYKLCVVIAGIYVFYLFENLMRLFNEMKKTNISFHDHHHNASHNHSTSASNHKNAESSLNNGVAPGDQDVKKLDDVEISISDTSDKGSETSGKNSMWFGMTPIGTMVFIGDLLHNAGDGLAIGVAFSLSPATGVGTSVAIFCHELPHELGDFAIYLSNGLTKGRALFLNFLAACCQFIGLYIGIGTSTNAEARNWMLALVAGMFLYISLVDVLHEMTKEISKTHPWTQFFLQNLGLFTGWVILLLLSIYEERLGSSVNF